MALVRAAQYVRMSREHQRYSIEYQKVANAAYAAEREFEIVQTYADAGVSGLTLRRREGLKSLLADVLAGTASFDVILVYDVSRWGRFQDIDQGAHYEFICREAGVHIEYTAEPFTNDTSLAASLVKHIKRAMAAEYSRDLAARVSRAKRGMRALGYWMGGPSPFGLRRVAIGPAGNRSVSMAGGEQKALRGYHTVLAPGPAEEVAIVRRIFHEYVVLGLRMPVIAERLNADRAPHRPDATWTRRGVRQVLTNEAFAGTLVVGRCSYSLNQRSPMPRAAWVRVPNAVEPIVSLEVFALAKARMRVVGPSLSDQDLLAQLRDVLVRHGSLSRRIIDADSGCRCSAVYGKRFGNLSRAYALVGYAPSLRQTVAAERLFEEPIWGRRAPTAWTDEALMHHLRLLLKRYGRLSADVINSAPVGPSSEIYRRRYGGLRRAYALVGYAPSELQERLMDLRSGQSVSRAEGDALRRLSAPPG